MQQTSKWQTYLPYLQLETLLVHNYCGGARSKGYATLRNVPKLLFLGQDWARKVCRFSVLFSYLTK